MSRVADYEKKIEMLKDKIEKKTVELKNLKGQLAVLEEHQKKDKCKEIMNFIADNNLPLDRVMSALQMVAEDIQKN